MQFDNFYLVIKICLKLIKERCDHIEENRSKKKKKKLTPIRGNIGGRLMVTNALLPTL